VPDLHWWIGSIPRGIHGLDLENPLRSRLLDLAPGTRRILGHGTRARRASETASCNARVGRAGGENVGVGGEQDVGHHGAGGGAGDVDFVRVGLGVSV
jgi:hypothetical protein